MSDYLVTGKKGNGKSLICVGRMRDALLQGRPVATNLDLKMEHLLPPHVRGVTAYRLPDHPTIQDMEVLGMGNPNPVEEEKNGVIVLDEMAVWMNARSWADKERQKLLDWFVHSRKLGWDVYFIAQSIAQVDKQLRDALSEFHVSCTRLDRFKIPWVGIHLPKMHVGTVRIGFDHNALVNERWWYRGTDCYEGYDTLQKFSATYPHGIYSYLTPWHLAGRHGVKQKMNKYLAVTVLFFGVFLGAYGHAMVPKLMPKPQMAEKVADKVTVNGVFQDGANSFVLLSDGRQMSYTKVKNDPGGALYLVVDTWYRGGRI